MDAHAYTLLYINIYLGGSGHTLAYTFTDAQAEELKERHRFIRINSHRWTH